MSATPPAQQIRFLPCGDSAVTIEFGSVIDPALNDRVLALDAALNAAAIDGLVETVPTYRSLMVQFDPLRLDVESFETHVRALVSKLTVATGTTRRWRVPVVYGGAFGVDLEDVAKFHKTTPSRIIDLHSAAVYRIYMIGFMPGYIYLGGLDPRLAIPRRLDPRLKTPAGTISIGGIQALIASPREMPSGWHLLGRTPVRTVMFERDPAFFMAPGDEVVFEPVSPERWDALEARAAAGDLVAELVTP